MGDSAVCCGHKNKIGGLNFFESGKYAGAGFNILPVAVKNNGYSKVRGRRVRFEGLGKDVDDGASQIGLVDVQGSIDRLGFLIPANVGPDSEKVLQAGPFPNAGVVDEASESVKLHVDDGRLKRIGGYLNAAGLEVTECPVGVRDLAELLGLVSDGSISGKIAKEVFEVMTSTGKGAREIVEEKGLGQISDVDALEAIVVRVVVANPGPAEEFRQGRDRVLGFFVGQVMKETRGQANPQLVNELLRKHLGTSAE